MVGTNLIIPDSLAGVNGSPVLLELGEAVRDKGLLITYLYLPEPLVKQGVQEFLEASLCREGYTDALPPVHGY